MIEIRDEWNSYFCGMTDVWLSLGSNEGDRIDWLQQAVNLLRGEIREMKCSPVVESVAWGFDGHNFLNCVVYGRWKQTAYELLTYTRNIEEQLGRRRTQSAGYHSRNIDIDILVFGRETHRTTDLEIPHPRMLERRFVLVPFVMFMPDVVLPQDMSVKEGLEKCVDESQVLVYPATLSV